MIFGSRFPVYTAPTLGIANTAEAQALLISSYIYDQAQHALACYEDDAQRVLALQKRTYKKVANKVRPVPASLPEKHRVVRYRPGDPLEGMAEVPAVAPDFIPGTRYTQERYEAANVNPSGFLWPEEVKLVHWFVREYETAFAWNELERGTLREDYFPPITIPTIEHVPWRERNIPIPPGIADYVIETLRTKIAAGTLEPSSSSYRARWFFVQKKEAGALRMVIDLQPLNAVTIKDSAVPPMVDHLAESFAARACYGMFDLIVAFDQRTLAEESRDLTTFQTPLGALRYTVVPMGYTNAVQIIHGDITWILQPEIPHVTIPFIDDCAVKGPASRYETTDSVGYETIEGNPGVRRFFYEHMQSCSRVVKRVQHAGGTFSAKKLLICVPEVVIVGHKCTYYGREADESKVQKIVDWPIPRSISEVRGFLGTCGVLRIFIRDYSFHARPLVNLTKKDVDFEWSTAHAAAMLDLKKAVSESPALRPIDYTNGLDVILAVDSSVIATGFILSQMGVDGKRYPSRFGSIAWNDRESRYSQAKVELYGLFRALRAYRIFIVGVTNLVVEVDAKYIKGMIDNPDIQPNATINRWIAGILLFHFRLVHVPGKRHGPDGLSRRPRAPEDPEEDDDADEWVDRAYGFMMEVTNRSTTRATPRQSALPEVAMWEVFAAPVVEEAMVDLPMSSKRELREEKVRRVDAFLRDPQHEPEMEPREFENFVRYASRFFTKGGSLWRKDVEGRHQLVVPVERRAAILKEAHDDTGHKGFFSVRARLRDRFWWPFIEDDIKWFLRTCTACQLRQLAKIQTVPPFIPIAAPFRKWHVDVMRLDKTLGFIGVVHARCATSSYPEIRAIRTESAEVLGEFLFQEVLCRWGAVEEIVSDNGSGFVQALDYLAGKYGIKHIRISAYNSRRTAWSNAAISTFASR